MPLTKLQFRPGVNRETTSYSNEGGWFDVDKVRFRFGYPEKIGGWTKFTGASFLGSCRAMHPWTDLNNSRLIGLGTSVKYYLNQDGGLFNDITPIRATTAAGDVTFAAVNGSATITVTDTSPRRGERGLRHLLRRCKLGRQHHRWCTQPRVQHHRHH
jgi:hypothetical protein